MTAQIVVSPSPAGPSIVLNVVGNGLNPKAKFVLTTIDSKGFEAGYDSTGKPTNINRPTPSGTFSVGINSPPILGPSKVNCYQSSVLVASANVLIALPSAPVSLAALPFPLGS